MKELKNKINKLIKLIKYENIGTDNVIATIDNITIYGQGNNNEEAGKDLLKELLVFYEELRKEKNNLGKSLLKEYKFLNNITNNNLKRDT